MAVITRHANAPFVDGETASDTTTALEADFNTLYVQFNYLVSNANVKATAKISGSKLKDGTIAAAKFANSTVTLGSISAAAVPKHHASNASSQTITSAGDIPGVAEATLTPGSVNDMILLDLSMTFNAAAKTAELTTLGVGWHVGGTEYDDMILVSINAAGTLEQPLHSTYAVLAPSASSITIKPIITTMPSKTLSNVSAQFRCSILPGKA